MRLFFAGDLHMPFGAESVPRFSTRMVELLRSGDFACGDFEAPLTDPDRRAPKAGPAIRQDPRLVPVLREAGFTAMTLANNHVADFGLDALAGTRDRLVEEGLAVLGYGCDASEAASPLFLRSGESKIALFACAEAEFGILRLASTRRPGVAWMLDPTLPDRIAEASRECDLVVVQCHAGIEEEPIPLPELRSVYRNWIRAGARFVVGHHPHVIQGSERFGGGEIHYSLGNAYFDHPTMPRSGGAWNRGILLEIVRESEGWVSRRHVVERDDGCVDLALPESGEEVLRPLDDALVHGYMEAVDSMSLRLWEERYKGYYEQCFAPREGAQRFLGRLKSLLDPSWAPPGRLSDRLMLLHNVRIESHRWLVERALTLLHERDLVGTRA